jgi:hypothetical protein
MTLEESIKSAMKQVQALFNDLEMHLILLANAQDQSLDDDQDFVACVHAEEKAEDICDNMKYVIDELPLIAAEIRGAPPTKEAKAWWMARKKERKEAHALIDAKRKEQAKEEAAARKALTLESKTQ